MVPQSAKRLRDEPIDTAITIVEQFGPRGATTLAEAQTAAYFDGRLRRAGMRVSADGFAAPSWAGWDTLALAVWVLFGSVLYRWQPVVALLDLLVGCGIAAYLLWRGAPLLAKLQPSQNIIATRALAQKPTKRVVILAPLDAPAQLPILLHLVYSGQRMMIFRLAICSANVLLAASGITLGGFTLQVVSWYLMLAVCSGLFAIAGIDLWLRHRPVSPGAVNHAGALAATLACGEELLAAAQTELWIVGVGCSESGCGLADLLRRYPFEPGRTRFIALESIGSGELSYITRAGLVRQNASDAELLRLIAAVDATDQRIDASPRPLRHAPTTLGSLRQAGWQAIGISCLDDSGRPALRSSANDAVQALEPEIIDRAVRLVTGLVRAIDAS